MLTLKYLTIIGMLAAVTWFATQPDFPAVMLGILSLSVFMLTLLPITSDKRI